MLTLISSFSYGACNFNTAEQLSSLQTPNTIKRILVNVPKSAKFEKNFFKILSSRSVTIPSKLKKKFKAIITVEYEFGICKYPATVKQSGDWKDHVKLNNGGKPFRSLTVKLKDGNILNAVKFKLLIPDTRGNLNEVLGSIILRELGLIAPETFQVKVNLNGNESIMLFQEDAQKELLERNLRREGPIFEGDESILWSYGEWENTDELQTMSLSRLTNPKWFLKGESSQLITLMAFSQLQRAYVEAPDKHIIFPNKKSIQKFEDYFFLMISMSGYHGLINHNRRFYYNSFTSQFEPIYYDGNIDYSKLLSLDIFLPERLKEFSKKYKFPYLKKFDNPYFIKNISKKFEIRVIDFNNKKNLFFKKSITQLRENLFYLQSKLSERKLYTDKNTHNRRNNKKYIDEVLKYGLIQNHITSIEPNNENFKINFSNNQERIIKVENLVQVFSNTRLNERRTIFLPTTELLVKLRNINNTYQEYMLGGFITYSEGVTINIDKENKKINIIQSSPTDWILFVNVNLIGWHVNFNGSMQVTTESSPSQRFNKRGLTGCMNFYNSYFEKTSLSIKDGRCEDSINIVSSNGEISTIIVENAYADGVDLDFSNLKIEKIIVKKSGNDCLDVSGGKYDVKFSSLMTCKDKAISVGEKSIFEIKNLIVNIASIGISSKDFSSVTLSNGRMLNVDICVESAQKKKEFGGGVAILKKNVCEGKYLSDQNSLILWSSK